MSESAIVAAVRAQAARTPERVAVVSGEQALTYAELELAAAAAAAHISAHSRGEVVGLLLPNTPEFLSAFLGALWAGKTVAVLPTIAPPPLVKLMAAEARLETVVTSAELASRLAEVNLSSLTIPATPAAGPTAIPLVSRAQEAAVLLYTSGTTGRPKAVALSDHNILSNAEGCREAADFGRDEVMLAILPLFHAFGLTVTCLLPLTLGACVVLLERFTPRGVLQAIEHHRATCVVAVPSQYRLILKELTPADTASLRLCIAGAERLPESVASDFQARFRLPVLQGYGATEAAPVIAMNSPRAYRAGTVGRPLPNLRVVLREDGREQPLGQPGEVTVAGPNVMLGYHNRPEATAEKLVGGELRTGDLGVFDPEGFLHLVGRADDLIKVAGEKIYPAEVERVLEQLAGIEEAVVVGVPDEKHGAVLRAYVQPKPGAALTEAGLRAACRDRLETIKIPRHFIVVEQLPRSPSGKADKRALAALAQP